MKAPSPDPRRWLPSPTQVPQHRAPLTYQETPPEGQMCPSLSCHHPRPQDTSRTNCVPTSQGPEKHQAPWRAPSSPILAHLQLRPDPASRRGPRPPEPLPTPPAQLGVLGACAWHSLLETAQPAGLLPPPLRPTPASLRRPLAWPARKRGAGAPGTGMVATSIILAGAGPDQVPALTLRVGKAALPSLAGQGQVLGGGRPCRLPSGRWSRSASGLAWPGGHLQP